MKLVMRYPTLTVFAIGFCVWLVLTAFVLVSLLPWFPSTATQWLVVLLLGVPLWVGTEFLAERLFASELGSRISNRKFSWLRVLYMLAAMLVVLSMVLAGAALFGTALR